MRKPIDFSKYAGEWVVICNDEIIAHNVDLRKIHDKISKCKTTPTITKVPKEEVWIF